MTALAYLGLTDKQEAFVLAVVEGLHPGDAARRAGYSPATADVQARQILAKPHVHAAILRQARQRFAQLVPMALGVLETVMTSDKAPMGARVDAAKAILDRGGFPAMRVPDGAGGERSLNELSADELRAFVARGEAELASRARLVNGPAAEPGLSAMMD